ncbi:hypothetical protein BCV69DRAFT_195214 [Microstroma glucosiphilum]|uniref:Uncharacterized protein n=1 Tax=Pseudomicrostroma glucosiphilum TaxID=1684307 RepID=A0A316U5W7_9BASI|nr:hypothetical protein BCV69DRAFT_195214 [Pseudomicrostroma glucosiphilum]PWN20657.1 hypothetical protein BCV69DRAFT_195214 [Pseudomicrostroma glucosiphilum]
MSDLVLRRAPKHLLKRLTGDYDEPLAMIELTRRAPQSTTLAQLMDSSGSGISAMAVIVLIGSLIVLWLVTVMIGVMCKYFNKPRSALHDGAYANGGLYRPSAAAYGARSTPEAKTEDPKKSYGSKASLLDMAQPMGRAASPGAPDSPDVSMSGGHFEMPLTQHAGRIAYQQHHQRSSSSSIGLPGPPAASRRAGAAGQQHPQMAGGGSGAPDGSYYQPGQLYSAPQQSGFQGGQTFAYPPGPSGPRGPQQGYSGPGVARSNSKAMRGPPPARSNSARKSRYAKPARVESLGPGEIRRYLDEAGVDENVAIQDAGAPNYSRRSMTGRRNVFAPSARMSSYGAKHPRSPSIYGAAELNALKSAQAEGFGGGSDPRGNGRSGVQPGRVDPLGAAHQRPQAGPGLAGPRPLNGQMRAGGVGPPPSTYGQAPGPILQSRPPPAAQYQQRPSQGSAGGPGMGLRYPAGPQSQMQAGPRPQQQYAQQHQYRQPQLAQGGGGMRQIL